MANNVARLASLSRDYLKADTRRLPDSIVLEVTNNVIEDISSSTYVDEDVTDIGIKTLGYVDVLTGAVYSQFDVPGAAIAETIVYTYNQDGDVIMTATYNQERYAPVAWSIVSRPPLAKEVIATYFWDDDNRTKEWLTYLPWEEFELYKEGLTGTSYATTRVESNQGDQDQETYSWITSVEGGTDTPTYWTIGPGGDIYLAPEINEIKLLHVIYQKRPSEITSMEDTSSVYLRKYWPLIRAGVLTECAVYLNEKPMVAMYQPKFDRLYSRFIIEQSRNKNAPGRPVSKIPMASIDGVV